VRQTIHCPGATGWIGLHIPGLLILPSAKPSPPSNSRRKAYGFRRRPAYRPWKTCSLTLIIAAADSKSPLMTAPKSSLKVSSWRFGFKHFAYCPQEFARLPVHLASHTSEFGDLSRLSRKRVLVIGGGQSAFDVGALLAERDAEVEILVRSRTPPLEFVGHERVNRTRNSKLRQDFR
jgi:hypothetical protein